MDKLPREIVLLIVDYLPKSDQRQMACVNQQWCDWIRKNNFFDKVSLNVSDNTMDFVQLQFQLWFFRKTKYGLQTKFLTIEGSEMILDAFWDITETFPNIERLAWDSSGEVMYKEKFREIAKSWKHIKRIDELYTSAFTRCMLSSPDNAAQLEKISLRYPESDDDSYEIISYLFEDLPCLKNTTKLRSLTLLETHISNQALKRIHEAVPHLKKLKLVNPLDYYDSDFYPNQDSAKGMKIEALDSLSITMKQHEFAQRTYITDMMRFISDTYTDLVSFKILFNEATYSSIKEPEDEVFHLHLCTALSKWHNLKTFDFRPYSLDDGIFRAMSKAGIRLQKLALYVNYDEPTSWPIQYDLLTMYPEVTKDLKELLLAEAGSVKRGGYRTSLEMLRSLPNLETLNIATGVHTSKRPILMTDVLNAVPRLKHLEVLQLDTILPFYRKRLTVNQPTQLTSLNISDATLWLTAEDAKVLSKVLENVLSHCPLLEKFNASMSLYKSHSSEGEHVEVAFNFKKLTKLQEIKITCSSKTNFKVTVQDKVRSYCQTKTMTSPLLARLPHSQVDIAIIANRGPSIITNVLSYGLL